jgi:hypothetical protein
MSLGSIDSKPDACRACPLSTCGYGYLPDKALTRPKIAVMIEAPSRQSVIEGEALTDGLGWHFFHHGIERLGYEKADVLVTHVYRCHPPPALKYRTATGKEAAQLGLFGDVPSTKKKAKGPSKGDIGAVLRVAEERCRTYDDVLRAYNPDVFFFADGLEAPIKTAALTRVNRAILKKAFKFADLYGHRPLVLCGETACRLFWSYGFRPGHGGMKAWRGSYFEGSWPL